MKHLTTVFMAGFVFALGLGVSGMTDADKVIGFLNLAGEWDPALGFVMIGAIGAHMATFKRVTSRHSPLFAETFRIPTRTDIDLRLVVGCGLFGIGWALGGYCPGPGLVSSVSGSPAALIFVAGLLGGMALFHVAHKAWTTSRTARDRVA